VIFSFILYVVSLVFLVVWFIVCFLVLLLLVLWVVFCLEEEVEYLSDEGLRHGLAAIINMADTLEQLSNFYGTFMESYNAKWDQLVTLESNSSKKKELLGL